MFWFSVFSHYSLLTKFNIAIVVFVKEKDIFGCILNSIKCKVTISAAIYEIVQLWPIQFAHYV